MFGNKCRSLKVIVKHLARGVLNTCVDTCGVGVVGGVLETAANTPRSVAIAAGNSLPPSATTLLQIVATGVGAHPSPTQVWPRPPPCQRQCQTPTPPLSSTFLHCPPHSLRASKTKSQSLRTGGGALASVWAGRGVPSTRWPLWWRRAAAHAVLAGTWRCTPWLLSVSAFVRLSSNKVGNTR